MKRDHVVHEREGSVLLRRKTLTHDRNGGEDLFISLLNSTATGFY